MVIEPFGGFTTDRHGPRRFQQAREERQDHVRVRVQRGQLDQQDLDLFSARLPEQGLDAREALGFRCVAEPEHRPPPELDAELQAAVTGAIDCVGAGAAIVHQDGEPAALERDGLRSQQRCQRHAPGREASVDETNEPSCESASIVSPACVGVVKV
jgi:hypothetical protein